MKKILILPVLATLCWPLHCEPGRVMKFALSTTLYEALSRDQTGVLRWASDDKYTLDAGKITQTATQGDLRNSKFTVPMEIIGFMKIATQYVATVQFSIACNDTIVVQDEVRNIPVLPNNGLHETIPYGEHVLELDIYVEEDTSAE